MKTAWQVLMSPIAAIIWIAMALILFIGWGPKQVDTFIRAWNSMFDDEGPVTGGNLPYDPIEPAPRKRGEDIG